MSLLNRPSWFCPSGCRLEMFTNQRVQSSPFGGSEQAIDMLNDRWMMSLDFPGELRAYGGRMEALLAMFRGQVNWMPMYHFARPAPLGTMRGTMTMNATAAQGASSIQVVASGQNSKTILAGDVLGCSDLLLMAAEDATSNGSGVITINLVNRLRKQLTSAASVAWDKPTALFRLMSHSGVGYNPSFALGGSMELAEYIPPT